MGSSRTEETGSAIIYILIAIALLAALTASMMDSPSQQTQSQNRMKTLTEVKSQIDLIRAAVEQCVLVNPGGDITINQGTTTDPGANHRYPLKPNSTHFTGATIVPTAGRLVRNIRCPGNPGDNKNHALIFGGSSGKFLPPAPNLFEDWQWYNGTDGVFFWTATEKTDAYLSSALEKLNEEFGAGETDIVDASAGDINLDVAGTVKCLDDFTCFRVWVIDAR